MQDLKGQLVVLRYDGREYEGRHDGIEYEGPFPFHRILETRVINRQDCEVEKPRLGEPGQNFYEVPGVMRVPVGACLIHPTHLHDRV